jgi:hypothetical protein
MHIFIDMTLKNSMASLFLQHYPWYPLLGMLYYIYELEQRGRCVRRNTERKL